MPYVQEITTTTNDSAKNRTIAILLNKVKLVIKTHDSESRGQEEAAVRNE